MSLCCPGPAATGSAQHPRSIYSGTGLITTASTDKGSSKRMAPARVAQLIGKAAYYKVDECWIARHPVLLMGEILIIFLFHVHVSNMSSDMRDIGFLPVSLYHLSPLIVLLLVHLYRNCRMCSCSTATHMQGHSPFG